MDEMINPHGSNAFKSVSDCILISRSHRFRATKLPAISAPSCSHRQVMFSRLKIESRCEVYIQDIRKEDVRVTLWGDLAHGFETDRIRELPPPVLDF